jgi:hypothetical protein
MSTLAKAVHRGSDGSVHYLSSNVDGSTLVITDPKLGRVPPIRVDGLCRLSYRTGGDRVEYEAIGTVCSTLVSVSPGDPPLISEYGFCTSCMAGDHDYELWPNCPSEGVRERAKGQRAAATTEPTTGLQLVSEPEPDPVVAPVPVTEPEPEPARRGARLRSLSGKPGTDAVDVDPEDVVQPARSLASRVWASGPTSKMQLRNGLPAASVDRYLECAQDRNWLDVGWEVVARGSVDPRPTDVTWLADIDGPSWG